MNAIFFYKIGKFLYNCKIPILPKFFSSLNYLLFHCYLPCSATIGRDTKLGYGGLGIVIHARAVIGNNVIIGQNVTIGGRSGNYDVPIIGNNVYIGAGAKILGPVHVGDNSKIGANAVVIKDVPANTIAVGVPAIIK